MHINRQMTANINSGEGNRFDLGTLNHLLEEHVRHWRQEALFEPRAAEEQLDLSTLEALIQDHVRSEAIARLNSHSKLSTTNSVWING